MIEVTSFNLRLPNNWRPKTPAQRAALLCPAEVLLFGGAAGSLKSTTMLIAAAQQIDNPNYQAIIFRKTIPEIRFLMRRSIELYTQMGASLRDFNQTSHTWKFPSGAIIEFAYLDKDKDVYKRQGDAFSFIGFDESTQFPMEHVRYIINSRGRSIDPSIKQQVFLATNPGNVGHNWHKKMFIGPKCTHCLKAPLSQTKIPGRLYNDAKWLDDVPLGMSTMFIPGLVTDHDLFGEAGQHYTRKLKGLTAAMCKALMEGCWEAFEGMYFDIWTPEVHIIEARELDKLYKPWWSSWVSTDYGFAHAAASYLFHKDENNHIYTAKEHVAHRVSAPDYAEEVYDLWFPRYKPKVWYASPDLFDVDGSSEEDLSRAEMMARRTGYTLTRAYNPRVPGWSICYEALKQTAHAAKDITPIQYPAGGVSISDECSLLIDAIPTAIHDDGATDGGRNKARKEDVKKTPDDEDDSRDGWRYGMASEVQGGERGQREIVQERIAKVKDKTVAAILHRAAELELEKANQPINYSIRGRTR